DVRSPGLDLLRVVLERCQVAAEVANAGGEPDARVAARGADLQHLAVPLRCDQREQELPRRARNRARALGRREAALPLLGILALEPIQHSADAIVQHQRTVRTAVSMSR